MAFLYGFINEFIYIDISKEFALKTTWKIVYKLLKALYNLRQSFHLWYKRFSNFFFQKFRLIRINIGHDICISKISLDDLVICIFIDNITIMTFKKSSHISKIKVKLALALSIADIGSINFYQ